MHNRQEQQNRQERRQPHPPRERLLTARQVEERLRVDASTIYRMAADGRLPAVKVGRQWRFPEQGVTDLLAGAGSATPPTPIDSAAAQAVLEVSAPMLGVMMVVTDMDGRPVSSITNPCAWLAERADDTSVITACSQEWHDMAQDLDFTPRFRVGAHGFECARAFVRRGSELVGMVLAGGVAPPGDERDNLHHLDDRQRSAVLEALPRVSMALSSASTPASAPTTT